MASPRKRIATTIAEVSSQAIALQEEIEVAFQKLVDVLYARPSAQQLTTIAVNETVKLGCALGHVALLCTVLENLGARRHDVIAEYYERLKYTENFFETAMRVEDEPVLYFSNYVVAPKGLRLGGSATRTPRRTSFREARQHELQADDLLHQAQEKLYDLNGFIDGALQGSRIYAGEALISLMYAAATACLTKTSLQQSMAEAPVIRPRLRARLDDLEHDYTEVLEGWNRVVLVPAPRTRQHRTLRPWPPRS